MVAISGKRPKTSLQLRTQLMDDKGRSHQQPQVSLLSGTKVRAGRSFAQNLHENDDPKVAVARCWR